MEGRREDERGAEVLRPPSSKAAETFNFRREVDEAVPLIKLELTPPRGLLDAVFAPLPPPPPPATLGAGFSNSSSALSLPAALAPADAAGIANPAVARAIASATSSAALASATIPPRAAPSAVPAAAAAAVNTAPAPPTPLLLS